MKAYFFASGLIAVTVLAACNNPEAPPVPVASATPTPAATAPAGPFRDDFEGDRLNPDVWSAFEQTGVIAVRQGMLEVLNAGTQPNFPYIVTRHDVIPPAGPFYFEISYKLVTAGKNVAFCLDYMPAAAPGEESLTEPFMRTEASADQMKVYFDLEQSDYTATIQAGYSSDALHTLRLEGDGKNNYRLLHNGQEVGVFSSTRRPQKFWLGTYPQTDKRPGVWPRVTIDHVAAGTL